MKSMERQTMMPRRRQPAMLGSRPGWMMKHTPNHNVHVITPHGKVMSGRKGRVMKTPS